MKPILEPPFCLLTWQVPMFFPSATTAAPLIFSKSYQIPNISNNHSPISFKARSLKFCIVVDLHNTNRAYHVILNYTILNHTKSYQIPNNLNCHSSVIFQAMSPKFSMVVNLNETNRTYHTIKYQIFQTVIIRSFFKLGDQNLSGQ